MVRRGGALPRPRNLTPLLDEIFFSLKKGTGKFKPVPSACRKSLAEFAPAGANRVLIIFSGDMCVGENQPSTGRKPMRRTASLFGAFCPFVLGGRQPACVQKNKNPLKIQGCPMRSSSAGAEMLADKEKAAENTLCILKGFDAV